MRGRRGRNREGCGENNSTEVDIEILLLTGKLQILKEGVDRFERNDKETYPGKGIRVHQCRRWKRNLLPPLRFGGDRF